jgi:hypothetical protein
MSMVNKTLAQLDTKVLETVIRDTIKLMTYRHKAIIYLISQSYNCINT